MRLFFSVGDPSGDVHTASLLHELKASRPELECVGYGGPQMQAAGVTLDYPLTDLAVMGLFRVVPHLWQFRQLALRARRVFEGKEGPRPDAVVLVDFPGFNGYIAKFAHRAGIPVLYYLPPQFWAWMPGRVKWVRQYVDHALSCFPFEAEWYQGHGVSAEYVGHPALDAALAAKLDDDFLATQRSLGGPTVALLPGSRKQEVQRSFRIQLEVARRVAERVPGARFLVANYKESQRDYCAALQKQEAAALPIEFHVGKTSEAIELADAALMVSGSVSLELLARQTPGMVFYAVGEVMGFLARRLVHCNYLSLPNLFASRMILPEYYIGGPSQLFERQMTDHLTWWLEDPAELAHRREQLRTLHHTVHVRDAAARGAEALLARLEGVAVPARAAA